MTGAGPATPGQIFICYRRTDTEFQASWLYEHVCRRFGREHVFKDVDNISPGADWVEAVQGAVGACDVLLALIGPDWLDVKNAKGGRKLDDPEDVVRLEIEAALDRKVRLIPVLIGDTEMPGSDELPPSLARLARKQAQRLTAHKFEHDAAPMLDQIDRTLKEEEQKREAEQRERAEQAERDRREQERLEAEQRERERADQAERDRREQERLEAEQRERERADQAGPKVGTCLRGHPMSPDDGNCPECGARRYLEFLDGKLGASKTQETERADQAERDRQEQERVEAEQRERERADQAGQREQEQPVARVRSDVRLAAFLALAAGLMSAASLGRGGSDILSMATGLLFLGGVVLSAVTVIAEPTRNRVVACAIVSAGLVGWNGLIEVPAAISVDETPTVEQWISQLTALFALTGAVLLTIIRSEAAGYLNRGPTAVSRRWSIAVVASVVMLGVGSFLTVYDYSDFGGIPWNFWDFWWGMYDVPLVVLALGVIVTTCLAAVRAVGRWHWWGLLTASCLFPLVFTPGDLINTPDEVSNDIALSVGVGWWLMLAGAFAALVCSWIAWSKASLGAVTKREPRHSFGGVLRFVGWTWVGFCTAVLFGDIGNVGAWIAFVLFAVPVAVLLVTGIGKRRSGVQPESVSSKKN